MRNEACAAAIVLLLASCGERKAPAPPSTANAAQSLAPAKPRTRRPSIGEIFNAPPRSEYETAVTSAVKVVVYAEGLKQFCWKWFPSHGRKISDAYARWGEKNGAVAKDIKDHALILWKARAGEHEQVAAYVYSSLRKDVVGLLEREFDAAPVKEFEEICAGLPKAILSADWNLERKLKKELALIRSNQST
ncbi:MAG: hypothetical protein H7Y89_02575 [Steroidobacteraceae bacterium]|nr:hypothetical protein [Steroidobacteraceae bacterium]